MKKSIALVLGFLMLFVCSFSEVKAASDFRDFDFQQERMLLTQDAIFIISSFENEDHITAYNYYGTKLWDTRFGAKIVSWEIAGNYIFVFSKSRYGYNTFLNCLDLYSGLVIWERP